MGTIKLELHTDSVISVKFEGIFEKINHYYNYRPLAQQVLMPESIPVSHYAGKADVNIELFSKRLELIAGYEHSRYQAREHVTYSPHNSFSGTVKYTGEKWIIQWGNTYRGRVYIDPASGEMLGNSLVGSLGIQRKVLDSFYAYVTIENLYNNRYYLRDGYPEAGLLVMVGLRILI